jgi:hypothetical protein
MTSNWTANRTWIDGELVNATLMNTYVRDNLDWLKVRPYISEQDFDGTFYTTSSASFQDTGANGSLTTTGGRVLVVAWGTVLDSSSATSAQLTIYEDGANKGDGTIGMQALLANNTSLPFCMVYITPTAPTAAAHEWKLYMRSTSGANAVSITQYQMWAIEIGA